MYLKVNWQNLYTKTRHFPSRFELFIISLDTTKTPILYFESNKRTYSWHKPIIDVFKSYRRDVPGNLSSLLNRKTSLAERNVFRITTCTGTPVFTSLCKEERLYTYLISTYQMLAPRLSATRCH